MASRRRQRRDEERTRERECSRKQAHATETEAIAHCKALERDQGDFGVTAYLCRWCSCWHVGHNPRIRVN
jgi:hypothetical protein